MIAPLWLRQGIILLLALAALAAVALDLGGPVRSIAVLPFVLVGPGLALTAWLGVSDPLLELTLMVVLSVAVETILAVMLIYVDVWSPELALVLCVGVVLAALVGARTAAAPAEG